MGNREIEKQAIDRVIRYERSQNRKPKNISKELTGKGYDIDSGRRKIEVKGFSGRLPSRVVLNYYNYEAYKKCNNFWLYLVSDLKSKRSTLRILKKSEIVGEEYLQFEVQLRKCKDITLD